MKIRKSPGKDTYELQFIYEDKRYRRYGFKSQVDVKRAYNKLIIEIEKGLNSSQNYSLYDYIKLWSETYKKPVVSAKTYVAYSTSLIS